MDNLNKLQELKNKIYDLNKDIKLINDQIQEINNPVERVKLYESKLKKERRINNIVNKIDYIILC